METWKEKMLDELLDFLIEMNGVQWTIDWLLDSGYTKEQLIELNFAPEDVESEEGEE